MKNPENDQHLEILKAVAQAWYNHSTSSNLTNEYDARRQNFKHKPSRFRLEAMHKKPSSSARDSVSSGKWDFNQSLFDSYEIVTVSKKLEAGLVFDDQFDGFEDMSRVHRKSNKVKESKNSLRSLFNRSSSKRFSGHF
ncbi:hypothetical protein ACFE04_028672 [Oxalis oulophora]